MEDNKKKIIEDLMKDKEAEEIMKLAFIMEGYESEKQVMINESKNTPKQGE